MSSKHTHRHVHRTSRSATSPPWAFLRVALALALAVLMLPLLGSSASAEDATLPAEESSVEVLETGTSEEVIEEPVLVEEPAAPTAENGEPEQAPAVEETAEVAPEAPTESADKKGAKPPRSTSSTSDGSASLSADSRTALAPAAVASISVGELGSAAYAPADEQGADDEPGQKDLTKLWLWPQAGSTLKVGWNWDDTAWSGNNTGDACALFDVDDDTFADFAVCVTVGDSPATQLDDSPRVYKCTPEKSTTKCFGAELVAGAQTSCEVDQTPTNPFDGGVDTTALCDIDLGDVGGDGEATLTNVCSYPSQVPNSDPSDCVLAPRDGKLTVKKVANPGDTGQKFDFKLETKGVEELFASLASGEAETSGVATGQVIKLREVVPAEWNLDQATCDNQQSPGALTLSPLEHVTCTFYNSKIQYADLKVTKDAKTSYDRDYDWTITKDVDGAAKKYDADGTASFDYDVVVTPSEPQDSNFEVSGQITVSNPNNVPFTGVTLADKVDGDACTITALDGSAFNQPFAVPAKGNGDVTVKYVCTMAGGSPTASGTNTAKATWDAQSYYGTSGSATGSAGYDFATAKVAVTDGKVTVTDDQIDLSGQPGGNVVTAPNEGRFDYSIEYAAETAGECTPFTNTASITDDGKEKSDSATVKICRGADLEVTKNRIANLTRTYDWDIVKSRDSEPTVYVDPQTGKATVDYSVVLSAGIGTDSAWLMTGTIRVDNPNDWAVQLTSLTDAYPTMACSLDSAPTGGDLLVPADAHLEFGYTCTAQTKPSYVGTNTATAMWDAQAAGTPSGSDSGTASVAEDDWEKTLVNDEVYVTDDGAAGEDDPQQWGPFTWESEKVFEPITYSLELSGEPGECVDYRNTAKVVGDGELVLASHSADVEVCWPLDLEVSKTADGTYKTQFFWDIEKSVDPDDPVYVSAGESAEFDYTVKAIPDGSEDSGWDLTGKITVANPNLFEDVSVTLEDVYDNGTPESADDVMCTVTYPDGLDHLVVPKATESGPGSATATYDCDFASQPGYDGKNHVTVFWGEDGSSTSYAVVDFRRTATSDRRVSVYDDKIDLETPEELGEAFWDDGVSYFRYTLSQKGVVGECTDYTNTAWVGVAGENPEASATATLCVEDDLVISKTVDASYKVDHHWLIDKSVDKTKVELTGGGDATFTYTVEATPNGFSTYGYAMSGTITVTNPNTYEGGAITATVTDVPEVGGGATCVVDGGQSVELAPEETKELGYTCSFTGQPTASGSNTATATWTGPDEGTSESSSEEPVTFVASGGKHGTVTVTDSLASPSTLGTATWNDEGEPTVFTYALSHQGVDGTCVDYTNTATITETGQSDSQVVTVCDQGDLVLSTSAQASYDRVYGWEITKVADRDRIDTDEGEPATVNYTVAVTPSGYVDSGWELTGVLTVLNPNTYKGVTVDLDAVPDLGEGATCAFDPSGDFIVDSGETRTFTFTCDFGQQPEYDGSVEVLVDWGSGTSSSSVDVDFEVDEATDETVTVTDDQVEPGQLGTVTWDAAGEPTEFEYAVEVEGRPGKCDTVTNTATIVETGQQAQADVLVCGPEILPVEEETPKPRPPAILPATGAPSGVGLWTLLGGLMVALGTALLVLRRRHVS